MVRIECNHRQQKWPAVMWKLQLTLNITKHKTTRYSALNLLIGVEAATPLIRSLIRDVALEGSSGNREAIREMSRQRAFEHICDNQARQDAYVNRRRKPTQTFELHSLVFVRKQAQSTGKLDSCMRGPYRVVKILPHGRYELQLLAGSYGKSTQVAAEYIVPWRGEWTPDVCAAFFDDADTEEEELIAGVDLRPGVVQPVEEIEPQQGASGIQRFSELAASTVNEENPLLSVPIVETDRDS
ncbi:uncharacterized protein LOC126773651 [Nymphalis io]|uniref:uncharacterized protein LOC126773651 n=1 Tax=Inachis io TaxID=171585 RepID=UPI0021686678|nr:uncharacterized protein LOC126773651 [Nymphalis io]